MYLLLHVSEHSMLFVHVSHGVCQSISHIPILAILLLEESLPKMPFALVFPDYLLGTPTRKDQL